MDSISQFIADNTVPTTILWLVATVFFGVWLYRVLYRYLILRNIGSLNFFIQFMIAASLFGSFIAAPFTY